MSNSRLTWQRTVGTLVTLVGVFAFAPFALAANSIVNTLTASPDPFHTQIPGHLDQAKIFFSYKWDAGGYATGDVTDQILDKNGDVVYYWGTNVGADAKADATPAVTETVSLDWNGKANTGTSAGQYVADGTYTFVVTSHVASPPDTSNHLNFKVEKAFAPEVSLQNTPSSIYYLGSGSYTVDYKVDLKSASTTKVRLKINGPLNNPQETVITDMKDASGNYSIAWDGKINNLSAAQGEYSYSLQAEGSIDGFGALGNELKGNFTVNSGVAPNPTVSNLAATPNPFNANSGSLKVDYTLAGSTGNTNVNVSVYSSGDTNTAIKTWTFSKQSSGSNTILWDGKNSNSQLVSNGSYIVKVSGNDGAFQLVPVQTSIVVNNDAVVTPSNKCAGFTDIVSNDSDCAAIEYMKSIGAMTGNTDGTFAPESMLQRDQVAKIILETFKKYNSGANYCNGVAPFSDVTSSSWAFQYICRGVNLGMITGYQSGADAGFYRPARAVNRAEFLALLLRNLSDQMPSNDMPSYSDVSLNQWFTGYAKYSKDHDLFVGSNLYPTASTTRREVAEIIYKLHNQGKF